MIIVFDLESTCWATRDESRDNISEIIQIGAVKIDLNKGLVLDTFSSLVRPSHTKVLSDYCVELTGITSEAVRGAEYFEQVYPKFVKFCGSRHKNTLAAWGAYDERQLKKSCLMHSIDSKHPEGYINASLLFKERHGFSRKVGLQRAVSYCGFEFEGLQHDAFWDALNAAKVFAHLFGVELKK